MVVVSTHVKFFQFEEMKFVNYIGNNLIEDESFLQHSSYATEVPSNIS